MFTKLLATLTLALVCAATPVVVRDNHIQLAATRHFNFDAKAGSTLVQIDQARARALKAKTRVPPSDFRSAAQKPSVPVTNVATIYTVDVQVGSPPTTFSLIVDTGSSNTWVGADPSKPFVVTNTTVETPDEVFVEYGSGLFLGEEVLDTVTFGSLTIPQQSLGAAEFAIGFTGLDGILGLGPDDLTVGTTSSDVVVPTVTDNLLALGLIKNKQIGIAFEPTTTFPNPNGQLTFGGIDKSMFTGKLHTFPITQTSPASAYVGIDQSVRLGKNTILQETSGIVDTGTTLILLASDALQAYTNTTGAVIDDTTGLLTVTEKQFKSLPSLFFNIGGVDFEITPNAQLWPRALNTAIGGVEGTLYLVVNDLGSPSGEGLDFINGFGFLERFFAVWDSGAQTVSFAETKWTKDKTN